MKNARRRKDGTIRLAARQRQRLEKLLRDNATSARVRVRAQVLLLSDRGWDVGSIVEAASTSTSTVGRVRRRHVEEGLDSALSERPRPGGVRKLSTAQVQKIIAIACTDPPEGFSRWSVRLLTEEVGRLGLSDVPIGRECIRIVLRDHDLKPWREKNVVCSSANR